MPEIRMAGQVSGMDIGGIIETLLSVKTQEIEQVQLEAADLEQDVLAWADVGAYMGTLNDAVDTLRSFDIWNQMITSSSDPTAVNATADSDAIPASYQINVNALAQSHTISSDRADSLAPGATAQTDLVAEGVLNAFDEFVIEGATITIDTSETLSSLRQKINNASDSMTNPVFASILDNRLIIAREDTGSSEIVMTEVVGTALQDLNIFSSSSTFNSANELVAAQDADFTVNGAAITRSSNTGLDDVIENVTLNLTALTPLNPATLTVAHDTESITAAINEFVGAYNDAVGVMEAYSSVELNGDDEDPSVGRLQGDFSINAYLYNLRRRATEQKELTGEYSFNGNTGVMDSLNDIGVWTSSEENSLSVTDPARLAHMLQNNFEEVETLFRGEFDVVDGYKGGVASDLYNYTEPITAPLSGEIAQRTFKINDRISAKNDQVDKMLNDLERYEQNLWEEFGAMENAMTRFQKELSYLTSQLGVDFG